MPIDANLSNRLSRGLSAVATTFGQYANAAHEERMESAKLKFQQMLADQRIAHDDARDDKKMSVQADQFGQQMQQSRDQHKDSLDQQKQMQTERLAQSATQHKEQMTLDRDRLAVTTRNEDERTLIAKETAKRAKASEKEMTPAQKLTYAQSKYEATAKAYKDAQSDFNMKPQDRVALYNEMQNNKSVRDQLEKAAKMPDATPGSTASPDSPIQADGKGGFRRVAPDGTAVPVSATEAQQWLSTHGRGQASAQPVTAGDYAQAQAPTPQLGEPDPSTPQLA